MKRFILVFCFFSTTTIIITWPLLIHLNSLIIDRFDGLLITWFLNWQIHAITFGVEGLKNFYNANIFYPYQETLTFSETMLPQALLVAPMVQIFKEPLLAYNLNFLLGFILTGTTLFYLLHFLVKRNSVAILFSLLFTYSVIHLNYMAHLQLFNFWPVICSVYFLLSKHRKLFAFFFLVSSLTTALNFYFLTLVFALYIIIIREDFWLDVKAFLVAVFITVPFLTPYYLVSKHFHYTRPITDSIHFSLQIPDLANISNVSRLSSLIKLSADSTPAYPGALFVLLMGIVFFEWLKKKNLFLNSFERKIIFWAVAMSISSFILALGPGLHVFRHTIHVGPIPIIPLPYLIFYYLVPGFQGFRTPSRWIILTFFSLTIALAIYFKKRINWPSAILLSLMVLLEINFPFKYNHVTSLDEFPPEQIWLKDNFKSAPIIQFPIYNWDNFSPKTNPDITLSYTSGVGEETLREYYSTIHYHPMYNGYSGFSPKEWENRVRWLQKEFPSDESISYLKFLKLKLVLAPHSWQSRIQPYNQLKLIKEFPITDIYQIQ